MSLVISHHLKLVFVTFSVAIAQLSCSSVEKRAGADIGPRLSPRDYKALLREHTLSEKKYQGLYNTFEVSVIYLNSDVQSALLQKKSDTLQWDQSSAQAERDRMFQEASIQTNFFVSLFTPNRRLNDLHKGNTNWKIYLETEGRRVEGEVTRLSEPIEVLQSYYPAHNRFSIAYIISFPVPQTSVERRSAKFVITSTLGTAELTFDPVKR